MQCYIGYCATSANLGLIACFKMVERTALVYIFGRVYDKTMLTKFRLI